jgi:hypothetical protein
LSAVTATAVGERIERTGRNYLSLWWEGEKELKKFKKLERRKEGRKKGKGKKVSETESPSAGWTDSQS